MFSRSRQRKHRVRLLQTLGDLEPPAFGPSNVALLQLLRTPDSDPEDIASFLARDPGLVIRLLRSVNSAAFGLRKKVDCVQHASTILGRARLEQLVLGLVVRSTLPRTESPGYDPARFWQAAYFRATLARAFAETLHPEDSDRCFTGGLLQDMAVPLLAHARPDEYGPLLMDWNGARKEPLHVLERQALGWSHDEVGALLAEEWELPTALTGLIRSHHDGGATDRELPPALRLVALVRDSDLVHGVEAVVETARADYGVDPDWTIDTLELCRRLASELARQD